LGDLENCLDRTEFQIKTDLIFLWGVYYHIDDPMPGFPILHQLARIAPTIVLDYLESPTEKDYVQTYDSDNPSRSINHASGRQSKSSMVAGMRSAFGYVYFPVEQMEDNADIAVLKTPRRIIIGSKTPLSYSGIVEANSTMV
jgi:hypothetical protein